MKSTVLFLAGALSLGACQKNTVDPKVAPRDFSVDFNTDFALHHRQQATLPATGGAELTVRVQELNYTFCPKGVTCVAGPSAWPVLAITDAQGQTQQLTLSSYSPARANYPTWLDTTSVKANGRRYVLTYTQWEIERELGEREMPAKQDFLLWFRVAKVN